MERADSKLAALGNSVREMLSFECAGRQEIRQARADFLQQIVTRSVRDTRRPQRWRMALLGGSVALGALALWMWTQRPLRFEVGAQRQAGRTGDLVRATSSVPALLLFSDGSSLMLRQGGSLRVLDTNAKGARVLVEDGTVDVQVPHGRLGKKKWRFEAGPFSARVTGTRFQLSYRALDQRLGLLTQEGQVIVSGPCLSGPTPVNAGFRLDLSCLAKPSSSPAVEPPPDLPAAPKSEKSGG